MEHSTGKLQMKKPYHTDMKKPRHHVGAEVASRIEWMIDEVTLREIASGRILKTGYYHWTSTDTTDSTSLGQTPSEYKGRPGLCCPGLSFAFPV